MKRLLLFLLFTGWLVSQSAGQDSTNRSVYFGIDVLKTVWPLVGFFPNLHAAYTLEPSLIISLRKPARYLHITPGFTSFRAQDDHIMQSGHGYYLKVGHERRKKRVGAGVALLVSRWQDGGTYRFKGSYFGDYVGITPPQSRVAVGSEFFLSQFIPIAQRLALCVQFRINIVLPYPGHDERPDPIYLPGVGLTTSGSWQFSEGLSLQFLYRAAPKRTL